MGKSLLTDEIIECVNRGEIFYDDQYLEDDEETKVIRTNLYNTIVPHEKEEEETQRFLDKWKDRKKKDQYVYKSRRAENAKHSKFQRKLNLIMLVVIALSIALFFAVFNLQLKKSGRSKQELEN